MKTRKAPHIINRHAATSPFDKALAMQHSGQYDAAVAAYEKILKKNPDHFHAKRNMGLCHYQEGRFEASSRIFHILHTEHPDNDEMVKFSGISYMANGEFDIALRFLKKYVKTHPDDFESWLNLTSASGSKQDNNEALYYATQALSLKPLDPRSHINLGAALLPLHKYDQALISFDTALLLQPDNVSALMNKATVCYLIGQPQKALKIYEQCEGLVERAFSSRADLEYKMSFPLLTVGDLTRGWKYYNSGFIPKDTRSRFPKRKFSAPEWDGMSIQGKRLLVWREQGLGDEIKFASVLPDLAAYCDDIIIECDSRLVSLFQRSFPTCRVREQSLANIGAIVKEQEDFDTHIPIGSLMQHLRSDIADFANPKPYLVPDPARAGDIKRRLDQIRDGRTLVGICWRSGFLNTERNNHYTAISDWEEIFSNKNLTFVNLQYGDTKEEIENAERHFGVKIHQWEDIDLKNDLEGLVALISNLDCVVSAGTAVATFAEALCKKSKIFVPGRGWTHLGQEAFPWTSSDVEYYFPEIHGAAVASTLPRIAVSLAQDFGIS